MPIPKLTLTHIFHSTLKIQLRYNFQNLPLPLSKFQLQQEQLRQDLHDILFLVLFGLHLDFT